MSLLQLNLLGSFNALLDGQPLENPGIKSQALLIYLTVERDRPHRRESLFTLLWPSMPEKSARHNLNQAVYALRRVIPNHMDDQGKSNSIILGDRHTIQLNPDASPEIDIHQMDDLLESTQTHAHHDLTECVTCFEALQMSLSLYQDDFLSAFYLEDSNEFEAWAEAVREAYRRKVIEVLAILADIAIQRRDYEQALTYIDRQLVHDDLSEHAHRQKIEVLNMVGRRVEAMRQYRGLAQRLDEQLGTVPSQETTDLYEHIRSEDLAFRRPSAETQISKPAVPRHNLPIQPTPFIGRQEELAQLDEMLREPDTRLITIVGPGGIGKTRLAIAWAERNLTLKWESEPHPFSDGIFFIPFDQVEDPDQMVFTIAQAINLQLEDSGTLSQLPKEQLLNFLQRQKMLLLADNFEHLLDKAKLLTDIIRIAPYVRIVVTSRERLYLQFEHLFQLGGLLLIDDQTLRAPERNPAIQLFIQSARMISPGFAFADKEDIDHITRICQLVDGMPLALELAGKWVNVLTLPEIITEIENNLDFLKTDLQDVPIRQRSMRAVFNATWHQLTKEEQDVFARFSVFRRGCTRAAAQKVTGASIQILARLSDNSLIQYQNNNGRYQLHALMRQFAADILSQDTEKEKSTYQAHCAYFCNAINKWENEMKSPSHAAVLTEISADYHNIHQAWMWALESDDIPSLLMAINGLGVYFESNQNVYESIRIFKNATSVLEDRHGSYPEDPEAAVLLALLYARQSFLIPTGLGSTINEGIDAGLGGVTREDIAELAGKSVALLTSPVLADTDTRRETALIHYILGKSYIIEESLTYLELSLQLYRELEDNIGIGDVLYTLAYIAYYQDNVEQFEQYITECLALRRKTGDPSRLGDALALVATNCRYNTFNYDEALLIYEEAYATYEQGGSLLGMADVQKNIAYLKWFLGEFDIALGYLEEARGIALRSGNQYIAATFLSNIGLCQSWSGQFDLAIASIQEALKSFAPIKKETPTLILAEILVHIGRYESAKGLIGECDLEGLFYFDRFWFHRINTYLALVEGDYEKALIEGQRCLEEGEGFLPLKLEWGAFARVLLGLIFLGLERHDEAKFVLFEALQFCVEIHAFISLMHLMPILPVVLADCEDQVLHERAIELYAMSKRHPFVANSKLFEDIAEKPLQVATANLQKDIILAAQTRGQKLDWWETADMLLDELQELGWPGPSD